MFWMALAIGACVPKMNYTPQDAPDVTVSPTPTPGPGDPSEFSLLTIAPTSGVIGGGEDILITGTGFTAATTVTIDGYDCTSLIFNSSDSLTCKSPSGWPGHRNVVVTEGADSLSISDGFLYLPKPMARISKNLGTTDDDQGKGIAVDADGNVWVTGYSTGNLGGGANGDYDAFIAKYDASGTLLFSKNLGTAQTDYAWGVAVDASGNAWITGQTAGNLGGGNQGSVDVFVAKYSAAGVLQFSKNLGSAGYELAYAITIDDAENAWIAGFSNGNLGGMNQGGYDSFLTKYDRFGNLLFTKKLATAATEVSYGLSIDAGNHVWVTGYTDGNLGGGNQGNSDAFIAKYDSLGTLIFSKNVGTAQNDYGYGIAFGSSLDAWMVGATDGDFGGGNAGGSDGFVAKFDASGNQLVSANIGINGVDVASGIVTDSAGNVWITGLTEGDFGFGSYGDYDVFVAKYDSSGSLSLKKNIGSPFYDVAAGIGADPFGGIWITGLTVGNFGGGNSGDSDAFLYRLPIETLGPTGASQAHAVAHRPDGGSSVVGEVAGDFGGGSNGGVSDAFFQIYNSSENLIFSKNLGTPASDVATAVVVDSSNNSYVVGNTTGSMSTSFGGTDGFIAKYDSDGLLLYSKNFGTTLEESVTGVALDSSGNIYVTGSTNGDFSSTAIGGLDAFLVKFSNDGTQVLSKNFGTASDDHAAALLITGTDNIWITGDTEGDLGNGNTGHTDGFVAKFDTSGALLYSTNFGTTGFENPTAIAEDSTGALIVAGRTDGDFGSGNLGGFDGFYTNFNAGGSLRDAQNFGGTGDDLPTGLAINSADDALIVGSTTGAVGVSSFGVSDGFVAKFSVGGDYRGADHFGSTADDFLSGVSISATDEILVSGQSFGAVSGGAINISGQEIFAHVVPIFPPTQGANLALVATPGQIALTWDASTDAVTYTIHRTSDGGATWTTIATGQTGTSYTDTTVVTGTTYGYYVTPFNGTRPGGQSSTVSIAASSLNPVVTSLDITLGPVSGGTTINITGQYFDSDAAVKIGDRSCTGVVVNSSTSITCQTPIGISGVRDVVVTNVGVALSGTLADGFTYDLKPSLSGISFTSKNLGTISNEYGNAIAKDGSGNIWVTGSTAGNLGGGQIGSDDAFLAKYDSSGNLLFSKNFGSTAWDRGDGIAIDSSDGSVWVVGTTAGAIGSAYLGNDSDVFVVKFNASGTQLSAYQLGSRGTDEGKGIAIDADGHAWITGVAEFGVEAIETNTTGFVARIDISGTSAIFAKNFSVDEVFPSAIVVNQDDATAWVTGWTTANLGGGHQGGTFDGFLAHVNGAGSVLMSKNLGTSGADFPLRIAFDDSLADDRVYVTGYTTGDFGNGYQGGASDAFLAAYSGATATLVFKKNLGGSADERGMGVSLDGSSNLWVTGYTTGDFGSANAGLQDAFFAKYDGVGELLYSTNLGTSADEFVTGVAVDSLGYPWIVGYTGGNLGGGFQGGVLDAFISKLTLNFDIANVSGIAASAATYNGVTKDLAGDFYVVGTTAGNLGDRGLGGTDVVVAKYSATSGELLWSETYGTSSNDSGLAIALDSGGSLWVTGETAGNMGGGSQGGKDAFLLNLSTSGSVLLIQNFGTGSDDSGTGIVLDSSGDVYIGGSTYGDFGNGNAGDRDGFLAKLANDGSLKVVRNIGSNNSDIVNAIAVDTSDRIVITGTSNGGVIPGYAGTGAFVARYNASLAFIDAQDFPSSIGRGVATQGVRVLVTGSTSADLGGGFVGGVSDAFYAYLDGTALGINNVQNIGTAGSDSGTAIMVDGNGIIYVLGSTTGSFGNGTRGGTDHFMTRVNGGGNSTENLGTSGTDITTGCVLDADNKPWFVGSTTGDIGDGASGTQKALIQKIR